MRLEFKFFPPFSLSAIFFYWPHPVHVFWLSAGSTPHPSFIRPEPIHPTGSHLFRRSGPRLRCKKNVN